MDCNSRLDADEPCPCCTRSVKPVVAQRGPSIHWIRVRTARALVLVRLTDADLRDGVPTVDLTEVT